MRLIDVLQTLPVTLLIMLFIVCYGTGIVTLCLAIGLTSWFTLSRIVRSQTQAMRVRGFVICTIGLGQSHWRVMLWHILPNFWSVVRHYSILLLPHVILDEAFLSFLGLGIPPPHSSWGNMIVDGLCVMQSHPMQLFLPSLFLVITLLALTSLVEKI
jgi:oligopeptide transport system permease protein